MKTSTRIVLNVGAYLCAIVGTWLVVSFVNPHLLEAEVKHQHEFTQWSLPPIKDGERFIQFRNCTTCGLSEKRNLK